jgi:glyoxylate reductase
MKIHYHNRTRLPSSLEQSIPATYVSFADLLSTSDVISLNLSLTTSTRHIVGAPEFAHMKDGVVLVNTARGALIDEKAMIEALESGKVYSVGLDVYEDEPVVEEGLLRNENVMLLPHIGTATYETQREMELLVLDNLRLAVVKGKLITSISEQSKGAKETNGV